MWFAVIIIFAFFAVMALLVWFWSRGIMTTTIDKPKADAALAETKAGLVAWWAKVQAWRKTR